MSKKEKPAAENALDGIATSLMEAIMNEGVPIREVREFVDAELKGYEKQARNMLRGIDRRR